MKQSSAKYRYGHAVQAVHRTRALWMQTRTSDAAWRLCQRGQRLCVFWHGSPNGRVKGSCIGKGSPDEAYV